MGGNTKLLAIDYFGVIRRDGKLVEGVQQALKRLADDYELIVFTTEPIDTTREWLTQHDIYLDVTNTKIPALAYIDDRALRFTDWYDILKRFV